MNYIQLQNGIKLPDLSTAVMPRKQKDGNAFGLIIKSINCSKLMHRVRYFDKTKSKSKLQNQRQQYNGRWYHSKKEARYAEDLDWRIKAGEVEKWEPQYKLELRVNGQFIRNYRIDFKVCLSNGEIEYVEVKGYETDYWKVIWKITEALWPNIDGVEKHAKLVIIK